MRILLLGVTALLLLASCNGKHESIRDYFENEDYLIEFEKTVETMTEQQKQDFIKDGEAMLRDIQKKIDSDSIDPETRFYERISFKQIQDELAIVRHSLRTSQ